MKAIDQMSIEELKAELLKLKVKRLKEHPEERVLPRNAAERAKLHAGPEIVWGKHRTKFDPEPVEREACRHTRYTRDSAKPIKQEGELDLYHVPMVCTECGRGIDRLVSLKERR